jgi:hypothetical protein
VARPHNTDTAKKADVLLKYGRSSLVALQKADMELGNSLQNTCRGISQLRNVFWGSQYEDHRWRDAYLTSK